MPSKVNTALQQRMPVVFGPMPGPRQTLDGGLYEKTTGRIESYATSFLTEPEYLRKLLAPRFSLDADPVVTIEFNYLSELSWLAGRGFNSLSVRFPTRYEGQKETVRGPFLAVAWENKADPIITGREELGFAKLFCDIPEPRRAGRGCQCLASWEGHTFIEMELWEIGKALPSSDYFVDGTLHYRYIPRVGCPSEADFMGAVITPSVDPVEIEVNSYAEGRVKFVRSSWEQLPTFVHIVNALAEFPQLEHCGSTHRIVQSDVTNAHQRILD